MDLRDFPCDQSRWCLAATRKLIQVSICSHSSIDKHGHVHPRVYMTWYGLCLQHITHAFCSCITTCTNFARTTTGVAYNQRVEAIVGFMDGSTDQLEFSHSTEEIGHSGGIILLRLFKYAEMSSALQGYVEVVGQLYSFSLMRSVLEMYLWVKGGYWAYTHSVNINTNRYDWKHFEKSEQVSSTVSYIRSGNHKRLEDEDSWTREHKPYANWVLVSRNLHVGNICVQTTL